MKRTRVFGAVVAGFALALSSVGSTAALARDNQGRSDAAPGQLLPGLFPSEIALPDGFRPEGIATGPGPVAYFGSLGDGSIYRASLLTGEGEIVSEGPGTPSVGMKTDLLGRLFVAGGDAGDARVVDTRSGDVLESYQLADGAAFVNDVIVTHDAAWFTDSVNPVLYKLPLGPGLGLPSPDEAETIPLTGDIEWDPEAFNVNGIDTTPDGQALIIVQSNTGMLFRVDPATGETTTIDLGGESVPSADGLLREGLTLYAVQNFPNTLAVMRIDAAGTEATLEDSVTDPRFDVPTTVASFGSRLYLPNARFNTPPEPTTPYSVVAIPRP
ncbi:MAG: superoxide dismutase [Propionibacteriales bacterium]|nr:superoxide dismutase [Propionibacteriales bacterium]